MKAIALVALMVAAGLAGCAGDEEPEPVEEAVSIDQETFELEAGKGAIAGLLVDDRFRPIQLIDDPETEFQTTGFVLLQETGQRVQTTENGEFSFVDLEPGRYTLRVTAEGHEATPVKLDVREGVFNEINVVARRTLSTGSLIVTEEYTGFAACGIALGATSVISNCIDTSGESDRRGTLFNFTALNATFMIVEVRVDTPGNWIIQVSGDDRDPRYGDVVISEDVWGKTIFEFNGTYQDQNPNTWENDQPVQTLMFFYGDVAPPGFLPVCGVSGTVGCSGVGAAIGQRVRMLASVFVGEPAVDLEAYEGLPDNAT